MVVKNRTKKVKETQMQTEKHLENRPNNIGRKAKHPPEENNVFKEQQGIHQKNTRKGKVELIYGNGCSDWRNCFTCPKEECTWSEKTENDRRISYRLLVKELINELKQARGL